MATDLPADSQKEAWEALLNFARALGSYRAKQAYAQLCRKAKKTGENAAFEPANADKKSAAVTLESLSIGGRDGEISARRIRWP